MPQMQNYNFCEGGGGLLYAVASAAVKALVPAVVVQAGLATAAAAARP